MQFPVQAIHESLLRYIIMPEHVVRSHLSLYFAASIDFVAWLFCRLLSEVLNQAYLVGTIFIPWSGVFWWDNEFYFQVPI